MSLVRWHETAQADEEFVGLAAPVVGDGKVFINARVYDGPLQSGNRVIAFSIVDGQRLWERDIVADVLDSRSSAAFDRINNLVLIGSGTKTYGLDAGNGSIKWQRTLARSVVNSSFCVTAGLKNLGVAAERAYIIDYDGFQTRSTLYAINVSPCVPPGNPFEPGEVAWKASVGRAAGCSAAWDGQRVYVASGLDDVYAFDDISPPADPNRPGFSAPEWRVTVPVGGASTDSGFFGPCSISGGAVYAATYEFTGAQNAGRLAKVAANNGEVLWTTPAERTSSCPVSYNGRLLLSGGIAGFGSVIKLQSFDDELGSADLDWDTAAMGSVAPEMGGWLHHPVVRGNVAYVGSPDPNSPGGEDFGPYGVLNLIRIDRAPDDPGFLVSQHLGSGGSPALAYGRAVSLGFDGLYVFDPSVVCAADVSGNGVVDLDDLLLVLGHFGQDAAMGDRPWDYEADLDGDVDLDDLLAVLACFGDACGFVGVES